MSAPRRRAIHCVECGGLIDARLTNGREIYPHRKDLRDVPFWKCETCGNSVACHHKTGNRTKPLGCIANRAMKNARTRIHHLIDPLWKSRKISRRALYKTIAARMGIEEYHTGELKSIEDARRVYRIVREIGESL
jgi:hypothetical protein